MAITAASSRWSRARAGRVLRPAVFLDRDGVLIENSASYIKSWSEVTFLPGVFDAMRRLSASPHAVVVVTNQSVVGRGILSLAGVLEVNERIVAELKARGGRIDACYLCPHHPDAGCPCRKPAPGMLLRAGKELGLDLHASYLVGDAISDVEAARAVGARGILVLTGRGGEQVLRLPEAARDLCAVTSDLTAAVDRILTSSEAACGC
jgi:D-glycero-D-manno-heptose 1,7-bisphosphate phosphatase